MRFGMIAAAAVALVCAGQADAATFVQYQATGTGFVVSQVNGPLETKSGDFIFNFVVETDPGYNVGTSVGTGSSFSFGSGTNHTFSAQISGGVLSLSGKDIMAGGRGPSYSATINLPSYMIFNFNDIPAATNAAGLVTYGINTSFGGISYSGAITKLVRVGTVAGFVDPSVSLLPEPAAWAMMILGMSVVGFAMRRSNKKFDAKIKRMTAAVA